MKKLSWLFVIPTALVFVSSLVLAADVPADKATLTLEVLKGKQGKVTFQHAKHVKEYKNKDGGAIVCKDCHHMLKGNEPAAGEKVEGCTDCHVKPGEALKKVGDKEAPALATMKGDKADQKTVVFHKNCVDGCHKQVKIEGKNLGACKTCHVK